MCPSCLSKFHHRALCASRQHPSTRHLSHVLLRSVPLPLGIAILANFGCKGPAPLTDFASILEYKKWKREKVYPDRSRSFSPLLKPITTQHISIQFHLFKWIAQWAPFCMLAPFVFSKINWCSLRWHTLSIPKAGTKTILQILWQALQRRSCL